MGTRYPGAFTLSAVLHALVLAVILLVGWVLQPKAEEVPFIIEVVAGPAEDPDSREAPSPPSPVPPEEVRPIQITLPDVPVMPERRPEPVVTPPVVTPPVVTPPVVTPTPRPSPVQPAPVVSPVQPAPPERVSFDEFASQNPTRPTPPRPTPPQPTPQPARPPRLIDTDQFRNLDRPDARGAGGEVLSRAEQDRLATYFETLKRSIRSNHRKPAGVSELLSAQVSFHVAANGGLSDARITTSSGSGEFDRSVLEAVRGTTAIGARPDGKGDRVALVIRMRD